MKFFARGLAVVCMLVFALSAQSQQYYSYNGVTRVVKVRILPGKTADFYKYLGNLNKVLAAEQSAGLVQSYEFAHSVNYEGPDKYDVAIVINYKDLASLDTLAEKADPIVTKVFGSPEARAASLGKLFNDSAEEVSSELVRGINSSSSHRTALLESQQREQGCAVSSPSLCREL